MNDPAMVTALFDKAKNKLATARILFDTGQYDDSVSRAYYAVFHAMTAILYRDGLVFSKHGQIIGTFNKRYIKTGIFPAEFSRQIDVLFKDRQIGDYMPGPGITVEIARNHLKSSEKIINEIIKYCER